MRAIPDLMMSLSDLNGESAWRIRKTAEDPARVSVVDTIAAFAEQDARAAAHTWQRLSQNYPEVCKNVTHFQFSGQGQRPTPVADARTIIEVCMIIPGKVAGRYRTRAADIIVRYMGGDPSLIPEIAATA